MKKKFIRLLLIFDLILLIYCIINIKESLTDNKKYNNEIRNENISNIEDTDVVGTITIGGNTFILVQGNDNKYYLNHNYLKEENEYGTIFLDYRCNLLKENTNCIIYGHSSKTYDLPFNDLVNYYNNEYLINNNEVTIKYKGYIFKYNINKVTNKYDLSKNNINIQTCNLISDGYIILVAERIVY